MENFLITCNKTNHKVPNKIIMKISDILLNYGQKYGRTSFQTYYSINTEILKL